MAFNPLPKKTKKKRSAAPKLQAVPKGPGGFAVQAPQMMKAGGKAKGWLD